MQDNTVTTVRSKRRLLRLNLYEIWKYRDLVKLFVKKDFKNTYKQTILGPLWIVIKPFLSTFVFTIVFGFIANISTDGMPQFIFYMSGNILWSFFSSCLNNASTTFISNARMFSKVYFPRLVMPISNIIYNGVNFLIQFIIFVFLVIFYALTGSNVHPNLLVLLTPALLVMSAVLGSGCGLIISSLTAKYRDLSVLVSFCVTLWMYITPVVWPASQVSEGLRWIILINPVTPIVETFRYAFLGCGAFYWQYLILSLIVTVIIAFSGMIVFNQVEKNFIDMV